MVTDFDRRLAELCRQQHGAFHQFTENDPPLAAQIATYWTGLNLPFPGVGTPWSGVFVCWCMKQAGATAREFKFSPRHAIYVKWAIDNLEAGSGLFRAHPIDAYRPLVGDIVQNNRSGGTIDYAHAAEHDNYESHCAIVVETGTDSAGRYVRTIGGNETDTVGVKRISLDADGSIQQRQRSPYICVIQSLK
jgi:hypothetical protein